MIYRPPNTDLSLFNNEFDNVVIEAMNRNARKPRKANRGRRPVCNAARRAKRDKRTKGW